MIVLWESHEEMSSNTSEARGGGRNHAMWRHRQQGCLLGREGQGVGTLCSIQKSQKAIKNGHGQATFPFPSPHNLSQTIKIIISPLPLRPSRRPTGRQDHPSQGYMGPSSRPLRASREAGCLAVGLWRQQGRGRCGHGDSDRTPGGEAVRGETRVVTGWKETSKQWQSPFSDTVRLLKKSQFPYL